jgi:signal transduction histidine kinase
MNNLDFYLNGHMTLIFFVYGLVFIILGILTARRRRSGFAFADHLWLLSVFGFLHGLREWSEIFAIGYSSDATLVPWLDVVDLILIVAAYLFLFLFGVRMVGLYFPKPSMGFAPLLLPGLWILLALAMVRQYKAEFSQYIFDLETLARYFLCLPGCLLTAVGFFMLRKEINKTGWRKVSASILGAGILFVLYGLLGGLISPESNLGLAPHLNYNSFLEVVGVPVHVLRALCAVFITVFVGKSLILFKEERKQREAEERKERALLEDRNRIAMELHDGAQQILFSIGIQAEACLMKMDPASIAPCLNTIRDLAQRGITDIRSAVFALGRKDDKMKPLKEIVLDVADGIFAGQDVDVSIDFEERGAYPIDQENVLFRFFQEGLLNVRKHAGASKVWLGIKEEDGALRVWIKDNGRGLPEDARDPEITRKMGKMGLWGMKERLVKRGGGLVLGSPPEGGTLIEGTLRLNRT